MFQIGKFNLLQADEFTPHGLFFINPDAPEKRILLPGIELSEREIKIGEKLLLFVYLDSEGRQTLTLKVPYITLHQFAKLKIVSINQFGAFADWGLPKDLFIPYSELNKDLKENDDALVFMFFDHDSNRLVGSTMIERTLVKEDIKLDKYEEVQIMIWKKTDLGYKVIVNNTYEGLIYHSEVFKPLKPGDRLTAFVKEVRPDNKIDITINKKSSEKRLDDSDLLLNYLKKNGGRINLSDSSPPDEIYAQLAMSKKAFKRATGNLFKKGLIILGKDYTKVK